LLQNRAKVQDIGSCVVMVQLRGEVGMARMNVLKLPMSTALERLPWAFRALLGACAAAVAVALTYSIEPLRAFPLLLAFPTVILSAWFLGMWGGVFCAVTEAALVNQFLSKTQAHLSLATAREEVRLAVFLLVSIFLAWAIRGLARQRSQFNTRELQQRLNLANAERQLAEERAKAVEALRDRDILLQIALQAAGMGLWVWDVKQGTMHWSDEKYRMIGREPGSVEASSALWLQCIHPEDIDRVNEVFARAKDSGGAYHNQYRVVWPDGSVHWLESQGKWQLDSEGQLTRVVGVVADVTHRKRAEDAMLRGEKLAIAGRLAASIAHEINNPLEAVSNLLFLITLSDAAGTAHQYAHQALDQLMRVSMITQQTLKFHRQGGAPKVIRLSEILDSVLALFRSKLMASNVVVEVRSERETDLQCMPSETQQIFANLISNAIDAMPQGGRIIIKLRPSVDWRDGKTQGMRVTFCDSGVGMDRQTMQRIFEPFFTTKTDTGTGLGMWVVAQLVERHRGHVRVWSNRSSGVRGTAFSLFLPLAQSPVIDEPAQGLEVNADAMKVPVF
jgi:PAS domain S-box-containing protein